MGIPCVIPVFGRANTNKSVTDHFEHVNGYFEVANLLVQI
jgi:hypothetical protein